MIQDKALLALAKQYYGIHRKTIKKWDDGEIKSAWRDNDGNLCIKYASGNVWTYAERIDFNSEEIIDLEFW